jgi:hypothetical protein
VLSWGANNADLYSVVLYVLTQVVVVGYSEYSHDVLDVLTKRGSPPSTHVRYMALALTGYSDCAHGELCVLLRIGLGRELLKSGL